MDMSQYNTVKYSKVEDIGTAADETEQVGVPADKKPASARRKWASLRS